MKKRQRMVAMLLSLTMVFGLCTSERAVQTVKAQEAEEIRKEQAVPDLQENPAGAQTKPEQGQEEILKDTAEDIKKADDPDETMSVDKKEEVEISEESEQPDEVTAAQELAPLSASDLSNPRTEGQKVTWDCVWFGSLVLVYKCGQEKLNNLYYQMKEQRRCSTWRKIKNLTLRNLNSRSWICIMPEEPRIHNWNVNMA